MSKKTSTVLDKLAEYEAAKRSTQPLYDEWSQTYEQDLVGNLGYTGHLIAAKALAGVAPDKGASIIDIGCGTGLVGQELKALGYTHIDGIDISEEMLNVARPKAIYGKLVSGDLMQTTVIEAGAYQAAVCAGSFAPGHLGPECYPEIIRMVQPGSPIVIFMNGAHFVEDGYQAHIDRLEQSGVWTVIEIKAFNYMSALERPGRLIVARKC
jgi:ubiquinone/menaquinone biosynthesis C-methylase UbiE